MLTFVKGKKSLYGEIEKIAKSLEPRELWLEVDNMRVANRDKVNRLLELSTEIVSDAEYDKIAKSFEFDNFYFGALLKEKTEIEKSIGFAEIKDTLPEPVITFNDDNEPVLGYLEPEEL